MKKPMARKESISDQARTVATTLWGMYPAMKPVGEARQRRDLIELDAILALISKDDLYRLVAGLRLDTFKADWVSSIEQIAKNLPRIRAAMANRITVRPNSFVDELRRRQADEA